MKRKSLLNRKREFWKKFEDSILEIIQLALEILSQKETLPEQEDDLNRVFYGCLVEANYRLQKNNKGRESPPIYEACNQPYYNDERRAAREHKRPDFQWSITDVSEINPKKSSKQFVLECKRLGVSKGSWLLNENYAYNGVKRFVSEEHGYARGVESSVMLGYIQSMEILEILSEVNISIDQIHQPRLNQAGTNKLTVFLSHEVRLEYSEDRLRLEHIWIDLKRFY
jgi:hypothetical protein